MNEIKVGRMFLAASAMFIVWIALEILAQSIFALIAERFFLQTSEEMWRQVVDVSQWTVLNTAVNTFITVVNCTILIWLYASLRPMYGVGAKTALITSAFGIAWLFSIFASLANLGLIPPQLALLDGVIEAIELPIVMFVAAGVYEGPEKEPQETE